MFLELQVAPGSGRPEVDLMQKIGLVLTDDPTPYPSPVVDRLEQLHQALAHWVIPRLFIVADGGHPPAGISFAPPS